MMQVGVVGTSRNPKLSHHTSGLCRGGAGRQELEGDRAVYDRMNRLSLLQMNRLKFKTARKLPIILEEFIEIYPNLIKENRRMSTCNRLDLQTLGSQPVMPKNLPDDWHARHA